MTATAVATVHEVNRWGNPNGEPLCLVGSGLGCWGGNGNAKVDTQTEDSAATTLLEEPTPQQEQKVRERRGWERLVRPETGVTDPMPTPTWRWRRKHPQWLKREEKRREVMAALDAVARRITS